MTMKLIPSKKKGSPVTQRSGDIDGFNDEEEKVQPIEIYNDKIRSSSVIQKLTSSEAGIGYKNSQGFEPIQEAPYEQVRTYSQFIEPIGFNLGTSQGTTTQ